VHSWETLFRTSGDQKHSVTRDLGRPIMLMICIWKGLAGSFCRQQRNIAYGKIMLARQYFVSATYVDGTEVAQCARFHPCKIPWRLYDRLAIHVVLARGVWCMNRRSEILRCTGVPSFPFGADRAGCLRHQRWAAGHQIPASKLINA